MTLHTYQATYETGWHAMVRAESVREARQRLRMTGRGEKFSMARVDGAVFAVWGSDEDDTYDEGE